MDGREAGRLVLEAGKSGDLVAALRCVAEATAPQGGLRYARAVSTDLERMIVCRVYAQAIGELCHLVNAADACGRGVDGYERFLFAPGRATPASFRARLDGAVGERGWRRPGFSRTARGIAIDYRDGSVEVSYARMPVLAALLEFLIAVLSYAEIDAAFRDMLAEPSGRAAVRRAAGAIERAFYAWLVDRLAGRRAQAKFRRILDHFGRTSPGRDIEISDDAVLGFWRACSHPEADGPGHFRLYRTAFEAVVDFMRALDLATAREAVERAGPLREAGLDGAAAQALAEAEDEERSPLAVLAERPADRVRFLTARERRSLAPLLDLGVAGERLPLSVLRAESFGAWQARIVETLRRGRPVGPLLACSGAATYDDLVRGLRALRDRLQRVIGAAAHVLLRRPEAGNVVVLRPEAPGALLARLLSARRKADPDEADRALAEARQAYRRVARHGFEAAARVDAETMEGFRAGAGAMVAIAGRIDRYLARIAGLEKGVLGLDGQFEADRTAFRLQFGLIYAGRMDDDAVRDADRRAAGAGRAAVLGSADAARPGGGG